MNLFKRNSSDCKKCRRYKYCKSVNKGKVHHSYCDMLSTGRTVNSDGSITFDSSKWVSATKMRKQC